MGDYHDHYLKKDVLLLAGIFEKFIKTCLRFYKLDPFHYFSSTGLSWDVMLNIDGKESSTAKGVNTATKFNEFKDTLFNKKVFRHKMKIIQSRKHKIET